MSVPTPERQEDLDRVSAVNILDRKFHKMDANRPAPPSAQPKGEPEMRKQLRNWGIGLLLVGIASIGLPQFLDPVWGGLLIVLGILSLAIRKRGMFIVIGIGLILAGLLNILATALTFREEKTTGGWAVMGAFQIYWGISEILKFRKFAPRPAVPPPLPGQG